jgi:hypothetical protein
MSVEIELREKDYLKEFEKLEDQQLSEYFIHPEMHKVFKENTLKLVFNIVENLKKKKNLSYKVFEPLFNVVKISRILSIHALPGWDRFWNKRFTNSMQKALKMIREAALTPLLNESERLCGRRSFIPAVNLLRGALDKDLFQMQRSNWPTWVTHSENLIMEKLEEMERLERHSRGIYSPMLTPFN